MRHRLRLRDGAAVLLALACLGGQVSAADVSGLAAGGDARVAHVIDGDTVALDHGVEVRLVSIQAPKLPLGRPNFPTWPLAPEAKAFVEELIGGRRVTLGLGTTAEDRHGRTLAHVFRTDDGLWVQAALLEAGFARVYTWPDNRLLAAEMIAAEDAARAAKRGLWSHPFYAVRRAADVDGLRREVDTFQIVRGRVRAVADVRGRLYLNFADDWRTDFTVSIEARAARGFGYDLKTLEGREIEVRGWLRNRNGPMVEVDHPERIRVLDEGRRRARP